GLAKIGAVVVPLNWRLVADELSYILKDSGAVAMIYGSDFAEVVATLQAGGGAVTDLVHWIEFCEPGHLPDAFAADYGEVVGQAAGEAPEIDSGDDDLFIMYTSGTTGRPKGALHTHNTMTWAIITFTTTTDIRYKDRYSIALPLFHVGALLPVMFTIYSGGTVVLLRQFEPRLMWEITEAEKITTSLAVPAMLNAMLMVPQFADYDVSNLRSILSGASPVPVRLIEKYQEIGIEIHQAYGLTESGGRVPCSVPTRPWSGSARRARAFFIPPSAWWTKTATIPCRGNRGNCWSRPPMS
ncbi:MAG: AMP-binding protein, partial [Alphaproteobacteria bacterium]